jgi:hypothetical protein
MFRATEMQIRSSLTSPSSSQIHIIFPTPGTVAFQLTGTFACWEIYSCCSDHDLCIPPHSPRSCGPDSVIRGVDGWDGFWVVFLVGAQRFNAHFLGFGKVHSLARHGPFTFRFTSVPFLCHHRNSGILITQAPPLDIGRCSYMKLSMVSVGEPSLEGPFFFLLSGTCW